MCGIASVILEGQYLYPFCCKCILSNHLRGGRPDHHDEACNCLNGYYREGLVFLVRPDIVLVRCGWCAMELLGLG